ncbi:MAG: peptidase M13 [Gammaproteobacteria bacterium]|nr:peptidase M13 [Gammaproteobacteria bacterium]
MHRITMCLGAAFLIAGCGQQEAEQSSAVDTDAGAEAPLGLGIDTNNFDATVAPQDNFYEYVNGKWLEGTAIPPDKSNYGAFTELEDQAESNQREIIENAAQPYMDGETQPAAEPATAAEAIAQEEQAEAEEEGAADESEADKIGKFYASFVNSAVIEEAGVQPLQDELEKIGNIKTPEDLVAYAGYSQKLGLARPFAFFVNQDAKNSLEYIGYMFQNGLGLPDRDYYSDAGERFTQIRASYLEYIEKLLTLAGVENAAAKAQTIMELETRLAEASWTQIANRDRDKTYNKHTIESANELTPGLDWEAFTEAAGIGDAGEVVISQPSYFEALATAFQEVPVEHWQGYFTFHLLDTYAPYLSEPYVTANFDFRGRTLSGIEENEPRWKRGVQAANAVLGDAIGKLYVEKHFKPEAKERMDEMVANLRQAFEMSIDDLEWMSEETKQEAQAKLAKFTPKIGYPTKWDDYSGLAVVVDELAGNMIRSNAVEYERMIDKLGEPVDREEWFMTPQTVNAYYNSGMNEIVFPAAILQPPFFNVEADDAVNYGAIGAVIGHEFSHGFDDQGSKSDGDGNLRNWWTPADLEEFRERGQGLVDQYDAFSPLEGMNVKGELTLGENIGDLAGLTMAHRAWELSLDGEQAPVIEGFTGDQRFFMGWAQIWRRKYQEDELRKRLLTDPHSPSEFRVNGVLPNMPTFYEAFPVEQGDGMYVPSDERVSIW